MQSINGHFDMGHRPAKQWLHLLCLSLHYVVRVPVLLLVLSSYQIHNLQTFSPIPWGAFWLNWFCSLIHKIFDTYFVFWWNVSMCFLLFPMPLASWSIHYQICIFVYIHTYRLLLCKRSSTVCILVIPIITFVIGQAAVSNLHLLCKINMVIFVSLF